MIFTIPRGLALLGLVSLFAACSQEPEQTSDTIAPVVEAPAAAPTVSSQEIHNKTDSIDEARIVAASKEPGNWLAHGRNYSEERFSPLTQINDESVQDLGLAWYWDTGTKRGLEATPIVVDGVMFTTGSWSVVYALNAKSGELIWKYDPEVPRAWGVYACCDVVNRGVALWKGKVYVGTIDGRLISLDAGTGQPLWETRTIDPDRAYTITGAPRIVKDKVIIGNGGAEYGVRGYFTAYDADDGHQLWRFYTVPGDPAKPFESKAMEVAAKTWRGGKWWEIGGGGTAWDSMAYDPDLNLLYVGTGNGSPWNRYIRSPGGGDNLYLSSIVAVNPDNGSLVWYFQTTPGDSWDYTATQHMILADLDINGEARKVIMQAPKNGFFYVIDRVTGEFISAEAYAHINWASHVDQETGRPVENPEALYANQPKLIYPAPYGGHNWQPMTYSPDTGLVYIPVLDIPFMYGQDNAFQYNKQGWNIGVDTALMSPPDTPAQELALRAMVKGNLAAWDPVQQKEVWRVEHNGAWNGGLLSTAGNLIFQGRGDGKFSAYAANSGKLLWETPTESGIIAPPVTYSIDGEQYVSVMAGWGGAFPLASGLPPDQGIRTKKGRILTYKLGGNATLPPPEAQPAVPEPPPITASADEVARGNKLFHENCAVCHGAGAVSTGVLPDLRHSSEATHKIWNAIVLDGAYTGKGMVSFKHSLNETDAAAIQAYVIKRAHDEKAMEVYQASSDT